MWFGPLSWYLIISLLGWALFPLVYRLFPGLYDRGYTISRALGLLLWGYLFWLLSSLGVLANNVGGYLFALLPLLVLSVLAWRKLPAGELATWLKERRKTLLTAEVLFCLGVPFLVGDARHGPGNFGHRETDGIGFHQRRDALTEHAALRPVVIGVCHLLLLFWLCVGGDAGKPERGKRRG